MATEGALAQAIGLIAPEPQTLRAFLAEKADAYFRTSPANPFHAGYPTPPRECWLGGDFLVSLEERAEKAADPEKVWSGMLEGIVHVIHGELYVRVAEGKPLRPVGLMLCAVPEAPW